MRFEFRIGDDNWFEVTGTPVTPSGAGVYRRRGPYRLEGDHLVSPAVNEGQPVHIRLWNGQLLLKIGDGLGFRLRRE